MRRKLWGFALLAAAVCALFPALLSGCTPKISGFTVTLPKTEFAVDEPLDPEGAGKLNVVYQGGGTALVNLSESKIAGFDSATSGEKTMTVRYGGKSKSVAYTVSGGVKTRARIRLNRGAGAECVVLLESVEFPVYAVTFTVSEGGALFPLDAAVRTAGWKAKTRAYEDAVSVLLYTDSGNPITENSTLFNFITPDDAEFVLSDISIADDKEEYVLPDAVLKNPLPDAEKSAMIFGSESKRRGYGI